MRKFDFNDTLDLPGFRLIVACLVGLILVEIAVDLIQTLPGNIISSLLPDWLSQEVSEPVTDTPDECRFFPDGARICADGFRLSGQGEPK